ncbi:Rieske (2Fe-2S) protein [candidate division KSB1 bacterium]|nr:Rieske (2Fe-2S) protein [candidate division KSB1 bacterium]
MFTRRKFLQTVSEAVALGAAPVLLNACAAGIATYRGTSDGKTIAIPLAEAAPLLQPNGVMVVRAANVPVPIIVRNLGSAGFIALSPICSHAGCEVRVMPNSFECPCHGSVYSLAGEVEDGPASRPLQRFPIEGTADSLIIKVKA